jgi:hypothetical protein
MFGDPYSLFTRRPAQISPLRQSRPSNAPPDTRYWLTQEDEEHISHVRIIGTGGYGEVHEVLCVFKFSTADVVDVR